MKLKTLSSSVILRELKRRTYNGILLPAIILFSLSLSNIKAQESEQSQFDTIEYNVDDNLGLFNSDEVLEIALKFDMTYLIRKKPKDEYLDALITFYFSKTDSISQNIRLKSRGNIRNEICRLPPIRLNFKTKGDTGDEVVTNMKLVTHCNTGAQYDAYLFKEYLAYKLYNVASEISFRVRLVKISYIDTGSRGLDEVKYGIIIEPVAMLANRLNLTELEDLIIRQEFVDPYVLDKLCLFQYMIGNTDWDLASIHNIKAFKSNDTTIPTAYIVPYDFDYSGLVDSHYAAPNPKYDNELITERIYMGPCRSDGSLRDIQDEFLFKKDAFTGVIENNVLLDEKIKRSSLKYLEGFFDSYKNDRLFNFINRNCFHFEP